MTNGLNDIPREKLTELILKHGDSLAQDRDRCEGLLRDHCGAYRREISALTAALHERVPQELKSSWQTAMTPEAMRARLIERLEDNRGLAAPVAAWAVDSWAHALHVPLGRISDRLDSEVINPLSGPTSSVVSSGSVWTSPPPSAGSAPSPDQPSSVTGNAQIPPSKIPAPSQLGKPALRSALGIGVAAVCVFGFYMMRNSSPTLHPTPCADKAVGGPCSSGPSTTTGTGTTSPTGGKEGPAASGDKGQTGATGTTEHRAPRVPTPVPSEVVAAGTPLRVRVNEELSSASAAPGQYVGATLLDPIMVDGKEIVPPGARAVLVVRTVESTGKLTGVPELGLTVYQIYLHNRPLRVTTNEHIEKGPSRTVSTIKKTGIASAAGCVVGGVVGKIFKHGGKGCGAGAGAGAAAGIAYSAESKSTPVTIAAETVLSFHLSRPLTLHTQTAADNSKS